MLVKKVDPEWKPSEYPDLQVGDTVEFDNPRELIIRGQVVGIVDGIERTPYELYSVWTEKDEEGYKEYLSWKNLQTLKEKERELSTQNEQLKSELTEKAKEESKSVDKKKK